jgi:hypothetical protein
VGQTVNVAMRDLAGNLGLASQLIVGQDLTGPQISAVAGIVAPGAGGDQVVITFDRPVRTGIALDWHHYTVDQGGAPIDLSASTPRYSSITNSVYFTLPEGVDLQSALQVHVASTGVTDLAGLAMAPADLLGNTTGDVLAPSLVAAYANLREDSLGHDLDVLFSEDVDPGEPLAPVNWVSSAGQTAINVIRLDGLSVRVTFATPILGGETISFTGLKDLAGNVAGLVTVDVAP